METPSLCWVIQRTVPGRSTGQTLTTRSLSEWFKCQPVRATDLRLLRVRKGGPPKEQMKSEQNIAVEYIQVPIYQGCQGCLNFQIQYGGMCS